MPEEEYFDVVVEVNIAYLKCNKNSMKPCFLSNLVYFLDIASGNSSPYEGYITAEFSRSRSSYAIN
jgi:hypothetical protein